MGSATLTAKPRRTKDAPASLPCAPYLKLLAPYLKLLFEDVTPPGVLSSAGRAHCGGEWRPSCCCPAAGLRGSRLEEAVALVEKLNLGAGPPPPRLLCVELSREEISELRDAVGLAPLMRLPLKEGLQARCKRVLLPLRLSPATRTRTRGKEGWAET